MYYDFALKFASKEQARGVLYESKTETAHDGTTTQIMQPRYDAIDEIGVIYKRHWYHPADGQSVSWVRGVVNACANAVHTVLQRPARVATDGWHANVRHSAPAPELDAYRVMPQYPARLWAQA